MAARLGIKKRPSVSCSLVYSLITAHSLNFICDQTEFLYATPCMYGSKDDSSVFGSMSSLAIATSLAFSETPQSRAVENKSMGQLVLYLIYLDRLRATLLYSHELF